MLRLVPFGVEWGRCEDMSLLRRTAETAQHGMLCEQRRKCQCLIIGKHDPISYNLLCAE